MTFRHGIQVQVFVRFINCSNELYIIVITRSEPQSLKGHYHEIFYSVSVFFSLVRLPSDPKHCIFVVWNIKKILEDIRNCKSFHRYNTPLSETLEKGKSSGGIIAAKTTAMAETTGSGS
jgi:hypothetical protein